jgi:hypothetical protein
MRLTSDCLLLLDRLQLRACVIVESLRRRAPEAIPDFYLIQDLQ